MRTAFFFMALMGVVLTSESPLWMTSIATVAFLLSVAYLTSEGTEKGKGDI